MLQINKICKSFAQKKKKRHQVLDGISLDIAPAEIVALVGVSGSGKSTLARCIVGLETPDSGTIAVDGVDVSRCRPGSGSRRSIQLVWQDPTTALSPYLTAIEAVKEALCVDGRHQDGDEKAREILLRVGLAHRQETLYPHQLSGGQCQRIAIARALAQKPRYLICDEPLTSLDLVAQARILDLFSELSRDMGVGLLFISHDLAAVAGFADRVIVMDEGSRVEEGSADYIFAHAAHPITRELVAVSKEKGSGHDGAFL